jgi:TrmH family RNA methyltransferase
MSQFKAYKKGGDHSYALGIAPTLELVSTDDILIQQVYLSSKTQESESVSRIRELCRQRDTPVVVDDKTIRRLSNTDNCYAIGLFDTYQSRLQKETPHLVLVNPSDLGNLGTVLRSMLGFGIRDLAVIRPAVDVFDPKVVRASMGALFRLRIAYFDSFEQYREAYPRHCYLFMLGGESILENTVFEAPYSLVFGNEGAGLPEAFRTYGHSVQIEQSSSIDSLNLAVAVSIALHRAYIQ